MQHSRTTTRPTQPAEPPPRPAIRDAPQAETRRAFALYGDNNLQRLDQLMQLLGPLLTPADLDRADDLLRAIIDHEFGRALVDADTRARAETLWWPSGEVEPDPGLGYKAPFDVEPETWSKSQVSAAISKCTYTRPAPVQSNWT